jgi:hypothetical protein
MLVLLQKSSILLLLLVGALGAPSPTSKHQDIGTLHSTAFLAFRYVPAAHFLVIDIWLEVVGRDLLARSALKMMDTAVALVHVLILKSALLEVTIHVGSHHE